MLAARLAPSVARAARQSLKQNARCLTTKDTQPYLYELYTIPNALSALRIAALHFLLGAHDQASAADSDDEDAGTSAAKTAERMQKNLKKEGATSARNSKKTLRKLKRAQATAKKKPAGEAAASFAAIHLLHDPHTIGEKLFSEVRKQGERFEVRAS